MKDEKKINKEYTSWSVVITLDNTDGTKTLLGTDDLNEYTLETIQENLHQLNEKMDNEKREENK